MTGTATDEAVEALATAIGRGRRAEVLRRLDLLVRRRLDGVLQGDYRGLVPGHGSEPGEARRYQPGDDVRRIDWNVTARSTEAHVRETIADRELETWVLLDRSPSLDFGTARMRKADLALVAVGAIGLLTARTGNRLGCVLSGGPDTAGGGRIVPARAGRHHVMALLQQAMTSGDHRPTAAHPAGGATAGPTRLGPAIDRLAALHRRRGLAVVVSDFLTADAWERPLARLSARHETLAIEIVDPRELELPAVGMLTLVDPETGRRRDVQTSSARLRSRYADAAAAQRREIARTIARSGADHLVLRTDGDWLDELVRFVLLRRARVARLPRRTS